MPRTDRWMDGLTPFVASACVLLVFGIFALLLELQSASFVQWDGIKVRGDTYGGVTTYRYHGVNYSIDNPAISASDHRHRPTTVWLPRDDPGNSDRAFIESAWDRWTDFVFLTMWFIGAFVVLAIGVIRKLVRRRRRDAMVEQRFGTGLDPEVVERMLEERRAAPRRIVVDDD